VSGYYPVSLDLKDRECVLLGGGPLAVEKARTLLLTGARVTVVAAEAQAELVRAAAAGRLTLHRRDFQPGDVAGAWLAIDASGSDRINEQSRREADANRVLLNVVDRAQLCDWIAPAVVSRGPLQLSISTSGESPFLAAALKRRLAQDYQEEWEPFVRLVGSARRRLRAAGVDLERQQAIYAALLRSDVRRLLGDGDEAQAAALAEEIIESPRKGRVWLVGAGPGGPELLTLGAREALANADAVFHDALVDRDVLALARPEARLVNVGKRGGGRHYPQHRINQGLLEAAQAGQEVVRLKGGDPFIFARGGEEAAFLAEAGVEVRVIPGVSAATAAPALAGIPLTLRGVASSVGLVTARDAGGRRPELVRIAAEVDTLVVLMVLERLAETAALLGAALSGSRPAAVITAAGTSDQRVVLGELADIAQRCAEANLSAPATLIVGEVVAAASAVKESALTSQESGTSTYHGRVPRWPVQDPTSLGTQMQGSTRVTSSARHGSAASERCLPSLSTSRPPPPCRPSSEP
jgi:uroporphyrin-III C-methyltransferase / precorrin-2 dehydrogenase / sirohydrochlorin ferrochelatase